MNADDILKFFALNNLAIESSIQQVEIECDIDFGHKKEGKVSIDKTYFPQFAERLRRDAARMSANYAIFYCLENSIREIIAQRLEETHGENWWSTNVPDVVRRNAEANRRKEISSGVTPRSPYLRAPRKIWRCSRIPLESQV